MKSKYDDYSVIWLTTMHCTNHCPSVSQTWSILSSPLAHYKKLGILWLRPFWCQKSNGKSFHWLSHLGPDNLLGDLGLPTNSHMYMHLLCYLFSQIFLGPECSMSQITMKSPSQISVIYSKLKSTSINLCYIENRFLFIIYCKIL